MSAKKNLQFLPERLKEVYEYRGIGLWQLLRETQPDDLEFESWRDEYKRDRRLRTISDKRLNRFAEVLDCSVDWLRGAFPETDFDPDAFNYASWKWTVLQDDNQYLELLRDLIFFDQIYPSTFTYAEVKKLTEDDLKSIFREVNPVIKKVAEKYIQQHSEEKSEE